MDRTVARIKRAAPCRRMRRKQPLVRFRYRRLHRRESAAHWLRHFPFGSWDFRPSGKVARRRQCHQPVRSGRIHQSVSRMPKFKVAKIVAKLPAGKSAGEEMNCVSCIHARKGDDFVTLKCSFFNEQSIPWDFRFIGCGNWSSKQILHNRDAAIIECDLCKTNCAIEQRGVLPDHWPTGWPSLCPASMTNQYKLTGRRLVTTGKQSAD